MSGGEFKFHSSFRTTEQILSSLIGASAGASPSSSGGGGGTGTGGSPNNVVVSNISSSSFGGVGFGMHQQQQQHQGQQHSTTTAQLPYQVERGNSSSCIEVAAIAMPHSPTPPLQRRLAKSFSVAPAISQTTKG